MIVLCAACHEMIVHLVQNAALLGAGFWRLLENEAVGSAMLQLADKSGILPVFARMTGLYIGGDAFLRAMLEAEKNVEAVEQFESGNDGEKKELLLALQRSLLEACLKKLRRRNKKSKVCEL
tara:strand:+ start:160 stop:525 length:366 start_codon:yes stop_codon:yes gene_type:complete